MQRTHFYRPYLWATIVVSVPCLLRLLLSAANLGDRIFHAVTFAFIGISAAFLWWCGKASRKGVKWRVALMPIFYLISLLLLAQPYFMFIEADYAIMHLAMMGGPLLLFFGYLYVLAVFACTCIASLLGIRMAETNKAAV